MVFAAASAFGATSLAACNLLTGLDALVVDDDTASSPDAAPGNDAAIAQDGTSTEDAGFDVGPSCDANGAFTNVVSLATINSDYPDEWPHLSPDELTIYFGSERPPDGGSSGRGLWLAERTERDRDFAAPRYLSVTSTGDEDGDPMIAPSDLALYFVSKRSPNLGGWDIWRATRSTVAGDLGDPAPLTDVSSSTNEYSPFLASDGSLWFGSARDAASAMSIYRAAPAGSGFGVPTAVDALNSTSMDYAPVLSADLLTVYFTTNRKGSLAIWTASRESATAAFGTPRAVGELDDDSDQEPGWLSPDRCRLYFWSKRSGDGDIFVATRSP